MITTQVLTGDCLEQLKMLPGDSVNLIITSPPYADQRKNTYGGIAPDKYWKQLDEQLKSFIRAEGLIPAVLGNALRRNKGY